MVVIGLVLIGIHWGETYSCKLLIRVVVKGGNMKVTKARMINLYVDAWYNRTLLYIDLDNGGIEYPRMSDKKWKASVKRDLKKILKLK
jgi:hypothetical protein